MTQPLPKLHPFPEVASATGIPLRTLRERAWARKFEHVRIGRERYVTDAQFAALLASLTVSSQRDDDLAATALRVQQRRSRPRKRAAA